MIERYVSIEVNNKFILVSNKLNNNEAIRKIKTVPTNFSNRIFELVLRLSDTILYTSEEG